MLRVPFILEMISAVPFMITVSSRVDLSLSCVFLESQWVPFNWFSRRVGGECCDQQSSPLKLLISLTGDFSFLQKPLHPRISQLLARQALSGKHDRK